MLILRVSLARILIALFFFGFSYSLHITQNNLNNQQAPAKVNLRFTISKFSQHLANEPVKLSLCIDKNHEKCFWETNKNVELHEELFQEVQFEFFINNMDTNLSISIKLESGGSTINFSDKTINLKKTSSKDTFELHSITLENFVKVTIEHECETGYYPVKQCNKFCFPVENEYSCDGFGNKICKEGLYFDADENKCLPNNCIASSIQCHNNGFCVNKGSTFECRCMESYSGKFCEFSNPCFPNPCQNMGKCFIKPNRNAYFCDCNTGFTGDKCDFKVVQSCKCPKNMRCNYSESGILFSCTSITDDNRANPENPEIHINEKSIKKSENKQYQNWNNVSSTTTIVAAVGCFMVLISIGVSVYVCQRTRNYSSLIKSRNSEVTQSNFLNQYPQKFESTFKRSFSLDDNSAYLPVNSTTLTNSPQLITLGSSNGFSVHSNSYQDNPAISFVSYPSAYNEICKQDPRSGYMIMARNCGENSNTDTNTLSSGSIPPPALPPRPNIDNESPILLTQNSE